MFKRHLLATALALAAGAASAGPLAFDPTGAGGATGTFNIDRLDWDPSGVLAVGGNAAIVTFLNTGVSPSFQVLSHATLAGGSLNNVGVFSTTGQPYEITLVIGFYEKVVLANAPLPLLGIGGSATFVYDATQPTFVRMYYGVGGTKDANQLAGTGFNNGTLIFDSTLDTVFGSFTNQLTPATTDLDGTGNGDDWNGQQSVTGNGSNSTLNLNVAAATPSASCLVLGTPCADENFFKNTPLLQFLIENVSLNVPFTTTDPSYAFTKMDNTLYDVTTDAGVTSTLGALNGGLTGTIPGTFVASGPDFMFQTDTNSSVQGTVPEPGSLALVGLALLGLGFGASRRRA